MIGSSPNTDPASSQRDHPKAKLVLLFAGSMSESIKLAPLREALIRNGQHCEAILVYAGQFGDDSMSADLHDRLTVLKPDISLGIGWESPGLRTGRTLIEIEKLILDRRPDMVVVCGESESSMAAAISAAQQRVPVAAVGAGLRSHDLAAPDEIDRVVTDSVSTLLFTTCEDANTNLLREGVGEEAIHFVGNMLADSLRRILPEIDYLPLLEDLGVESGRYTVVAINQRRNSYDPEQLREIVSILDGLVSLGPVVPYMSDSTRHDLSQVEEKRGSQAVLRNSQIRMAGSWDPVELIKLMSEAAVVITDSSEIQEQTTILGVPCVTIASTTSQQVTVTDGTNTLTGLNPDRAVGFARMHLAGESPERRRPLLWDGGTADRIVGAIINFLNVEEEPQSPGAQPLADIEVGKAVSPVVD